MMKSQRMISLRKRGTARVFGKGMYISLVMGDGGCMVPAFTYLMSCYVLDGNT